MNQILTINELLNQVLPNKVFYGTNLSQSIDDSVYPYLVYQEVSNRGLVYADNQTLVRQISIQILLITEKKDPSLENQLENKLSSEGFNYQMVTEYLNEEGIVHRVYEIKMED
jgi:hypothetical protein